MRLTTSQMFGLKDLHHAARKMRVCNIFNDTCAKSAVNQRFGNLAVTSLTGFTVFHGIALAKC